MAKCKGCGAEMRWVEMPSGRMNPVDVASGRLGATLSADELHGRCYVLKDPERGASGFKPRGVPITRVMEPEEYAGQTTYLSHFATCPESERFKTAQGASGR